MLFMTPACKLTRVWIQCNKNNHLIQKNLTTKTNSNYSSWKDLLLGVSQYLLFLYCLMFLCDHFFVMKETDFASYADYNIRYVTVATLEDVIKTFEKHFTILFQQFRVTNLKQALETVILLLEEKIRLQ